MKAIINIKDSDLANITFKDGNKTVDWSAITRQEQIKIIHALHSFHHLYSKFIKSEQ